MIFRKDRTLDSNELKVINLQKSISSSAQKTSEGVFEMADYVKN